MLDSTRSSLVEVTRFARIQNSKWTASRCANKIQKKDSLILLAQRGVALL